MHKQWAELYKEYVKSGKKDKELWKKLQKLDKEISKVTEPSQQDTCPT